MQPYKRNNSIPEIENESLPELPKKIDNFIKPIKPEKKPHDSYKAMMYMGERNSDNDLAMREYADKKRKYDKNEKYNSGIDALNFMRTGAEPSATIQDVRDDFDLPERESINTPEFAKIKNDTLDLIDTMPFEAESAKRIKDMVGASSHPEDLFWNVLFNFADSDIQSDMDKRFPGMKEKVNALIKSNNDYWRGLK